MSYKYYNHDVDTIRNVSWLYKDEAGKSIKQEKNSACFSTITYGTIPAKAKQLIVFHTKKLIPYSDDIIEKWIADLTEFGFPITVEIGDTVNFTIELAQYKYKMQVNSALQLIRCLYEEYIAYVPEYYFGYLDKKPDATLEQKFAFLQAAHKDTTKEHCYANYNHMVTYNANFTKPLKHTTLFERFEEKSQKVFDIYDGGGGFSARYEEKLLKLWKN